jgi:phage tail-like protein
MGLEDVGMAVGGIAAGALASALFGEDDVAVSVCFIVFIDWMPLGAFNSCDGLGVEVVVEQREEGGNNTMVHQLPTRLKYPNIRLTRPLTWQCNLTLLWFRTFAKKYSKHTATIEAHTSTGMPIGVWHLEGVMPVKWNGPRLDHTQNAYASETIELAHNGFLTSGFAI